MCCHLAMHSIDVRALYFDWLTDERGLQFGSQFAAWPYYYQYIKVVMPHTDISHLFHLKWLGLFTLNILLLSGY